MAGYYNFGNPYQPLQPGGQTMGQSAVQPAQSNGLISVRSKQEALMWPIAPGNSITFKDETAPYVYTKTMGLSQLDRPVFETYRLIKEDVPESPQGAVEQPQVSQAIDTSNFALKSELEVLMAAYNRLQKEIEVLKTIMSQEPITAEVSE